MSALSAGDRAQFRARFEVFPPEQASLLRALFEDVAERLPTTEQAETLVNLVGAPSPELRLHVRLRDGDTCRLCGITVTWTRRDGHISARLLPLCPQPTPIDLWVVTCSGCADKWGSGVRRRVSPAPAVPYFSPDFRRGLRSVLAESDLDARADRDVQRPVSRKGVVQDDVARRAPLPGRDPQVVLQRSPELADDVVHDDAVGQRDPLSPVVQNDSHDSPSSGAVGARSVGDAEPASPPSGRLRPIVHRAAAALARWSV